MANLFMEFKEFLKGNVPNADLLVPIMTWASGSEKNIEMCQKINKQFYRGNRNIYIREVTLNNNIAHIIRYPKVTKDDEKTKFFYDDICKLFNWTPKELQKNISTIDIDTIKVDIATSFGYDNKQRKIIGLGGLKYDKHRGKHTK